LLCGHLGNFFWMGLLLSPQNCHSSGAFSETFSHQTSSLHLVHIFFHMLVHSMLNVFAIKIKWKSWLSYFTIKLSFFWGEENSCFEYALLLALPSGKMKSTGLWKNLEMEKIQLHFDLPTGWIKTFFWYVDTFSTKREIVQEEKGIRLFRFYDFCHSSFK